MTKTLTELLTGLSSVLPWSSPGLFDLSQKKDVKALTALIEQGEVIEVADQIEQVVCELYDMEFPPDKGQYRTKQFEDFRQQFGDLAEYGRWVHLPWLRSMVHFPPAEDWRKVLSSRNRTLITEEEQAELATKTVMVAGLSVGASVIDMLVRQGIGGRYILVDNDVIDPTNLNRVRGGMADVGRSKVEVVAKMVSQLNPYIEQFHYEDGLNEQNMVQILDDLRPDVVVDEMDDLHLKIELRLACRERGIAVVMATDDGDDVLLDIERYDLDRQLPVLHGRLPQELVDQVERGETIARDRAGMLIGKYFVGSENVPMRMIESLFEVGKTLPSWPQLGGAAALAGIAVSYSVRKIVLGQPLRQGRFLFGPDLVLNPQLDDLEYQMTLQRLRQQLDAGGELG